MKMMANRVFLFVLLSICVGSITSQVLGSSLRAFDGGEAGDTSARRPFDESDEAPVVPAADDDEEGTVYRDRFREAYQNKYGEESIDTAAGEGSVTDEVPSDAVGNFNPDNGSVVGVGSLPEGDSVADGESVAEGDSIAVVDTLPEGGSADDVVSGDAGHYGEIAGEDSVVAVEGTGGEVAPFDHNADSGIFAVENNEEAVVSSVGSSEDFVILKDDRRCPLNSNGTVQFANPISCASYYVCYNGNAHLLNCEGTDLYSEINGACVASDLSTCAILAPIVINNSPRCALEKQQGLPIYFCKQDSYASYYKCENGNAIEYECPKGLIWNTNNNVCEFYGNKCNNCIKNDVVAAAPVQNEEKK